MDTNVDLDSVLAVLTDVHPDELAHLAQLARGLTPHIDTAGGAAGSGVPLDGR